MPELATESILFSNSIQEVVANVKFQIPGPMAGELF
jgi:hypothetical protein